ncbi:hypothetical protein [Mesorhizobium sp. dw_380]|uniref:hypothetical protein n=1 Tax=Mesorhizobium sp. dw_380 TaxID=2812001 RepID=UPI003321E6A5
MTDEILVGHRLGLTRGDRLRLWVVGRARNRVALIRRIVVKHQLVFERKRDRIVEFMIGGWLDSHRFFGNGVLGPGDLVRGLVLDVKIPIERRGKLVVHRQIVFEGRNIFERTGDGIVEIGVEGRFDGWRGFGSTGIRRTGDGRMVIVTREIHMEIVVERKGKIVVRGMSGSRFECRLMNLDNGSGDTVAGVELAHQLLFEVDVEIGLLHGLTGSRGLGLARRLLLDRLARVKSHDPGQFREGIIVSDVVVVGYSQLGSVCHYCSRTRTHSDAMDVAQGWPLPAQCGQKVTGFLVKPNAFR